MRAADRHHWRLEAFGARIALASDLEGAGAVLRAVPRATIDRLGAGRHATTPDVSYRIEQLREGALRFERAGAEIATGGPDVVLRRVVDSLHFDVALHAREASFLHASVVRWQGRLLVFPGRSRSGKSTLAAFFVERGAAYYSDEYAPVDEQGRILPYLKPISLRPDMSERWAAAGADATGHPAAAAHAVVFTSYRPSARFRPQPVTVETAALSLVDNSVVAVPHPRQTAEAVARLLAHRPRVVQGTRGEVEEFATELTRWLGSVP